MAKNFVKFVGFGLIALFAVSCNRAKETKVEVEKKVEIAKQDVKQDAKTDDISPEKLDLIIEKQIRKSPFMAIRIEKYASEEVKKEMTKMRQEANVVQLLLQKSEITVLKEQNSSLSKENVHLLALQSDLRREIFKLEQERDQLKKLSDSASAYKQRVFDLEAKISALEKEQERVEKEETQKAPSVISKENTKEVPVCIEYSGFAYTVTVVYFKITRKKTGKSYIYGVPDPTQVYLILLDHNYSRIVNLAPGEYTVQVTTEYPLKDTNLPPPQTFTVAEEPIADFQRQKVHAVVSF